MGLEKSPADTETGYKCRPVVKVGMDARNGDLARRHRPSLPMLIDKTDKSGNLSPVLDAFQHTCVAIGNFQASHFRQLRRGM